MTFSASRQPPGADQDAETDDAVLAEPLDGALSPVIVVVLLVIVIGGVTDLVLDKPPTLLSLHVLFEAAMVAISLGVAIYLYRGWRQAGRRLDAARASLQLSARQLSERQAERDAWRKSAEQALAGLSRAIDAQFEAWGLSRAEREVAILILKGAGHKQAAAQLGRSERTVRQHAVEVYRKAGLQGRAELAAFFLQDLLASPPARRD